MQEDGEAENIQTDACFLKPKSVLYITVVVCWHIKNEVCLCNRGSVLNAALE